MQNKTFYNLSITIFGILTLTFLISSVGFIFHIPINVFNLLIPICLGIYYLFKNSDTKREFFIQLLFLSVIIFVSYGIALNVWDGTWDGRGYHSAAIIMFKNGWLPIYDNIEQITEKLGLYRFNTHYIEPLVKFSEITGANIYNLTGHIESPKTSNLLFVSSLFMYSFSVIKNILKKNFISIILSVCICLNTPCIVQLLSNYVDIQLYFAFTFLIFTVLKIEKSDMWTKTDLFMIVMSSLMLSTVKLSGLAYTIVIYLCWGIFRILLKKEIKNIVISALSVFILILITCINPFYTNFKNHSHPFYPLMGKDKYDVVEFQYPNGFKEMNHFQKFLISTFSESTKGIETYGASYLNKIYYLKIPFSRVNYSALTKFDSPDMRVGGFGIYWSGILCLTFLLLCFLRFNSKEDKQLLIFLIATVFLTVIINPLSWWARFVPQFWLIPIIAMIFAFTNNNIKYQKFIIFLSYLCIFFIFYNSVFPIKDQTTDKYWFTRGYKKYLNTIKSQSSPNGIYLMQNRQPNDNVADETVRPHLKEENIKITDVDFDKEKLYSEGFACCQIAPVVGEYYFYKPVEDK